jgi:hypothetical protein
MVQNFDNGVGDRGILRGVADKYLGHVDICTCILLFAAPFSYFDPPPTTT